MVPIAPHVWLATVSQLWQDNLQEEGYGAYSPTCVAGYCLTTVA